jgi:hypothetical protein
MAHWLLRERTAEHNEDGLRAKDGQHRREQNKGSDARASEPRERSAPAERRARERVGESERHSPSGN